MSRMAHATQVDLGFGNSTRELLNFSARAGPGNFARERFNLFGQFGIGTNGKAERVAKRVSRRASAANSGLRAVLARAFARFALIFCALVMPSRSLQSISVDDFKFGFLNLLHGWSKRVSKRCPMAFKLVQCSITAGLRHCNHALDPLELIKAFGQRVGHDRVRCQTGRLENSFDLFDSAWFPLGPFFWKPAA